MLVVGLRWIYKVKYAADGGVEKYKARFVAKGYAQKEGIDYEETFAPVAKYTSIRSVISLKKHMGWKIHQMDVKIAFLNGVIEEEAHQRLQGKPSYKIQHEGFGTDALFPGLDVWQQKGGIFLGQGRYATKILKRFKMQHCRPMATPMITNWKKIDASKDTEVDPTLYRQLIGSLMYLVNTRPDICYAVNTLSQFMVEPKRAHWAAAKHVLKYIRGTVEHGLMYTQGNDIRMSGFTDAD
eukprot:PITA_28123